MLAGEFPPATREAWLAAVDKVLAGKDQDLTRTDLDQRFARQLVTSTYDGIAVQPLYTATDPPPSAWRAGIPGFWPFERGGTALGSVQSGWDVRQPLELGQLVTGSGRSLALDQLERGATSLLLQDSAAGTDAATACDVELFDTALDGVYLDLATIALGTELGLAGARSLGDLWSRRGTGVEAARGVLGLDPIGDMASGGGPLDLEAVGGAIELARTFAPYPHVRSLVVDATRYHEAGAADIEEMACATATGVAYLRLLVEAGLPMAEAFDQLEFRLAATNDQFSSLAKFRASRRLWARVAEVLGVPAAGAQRQHAITSRAMLTRYDPSVNLLRNTVACFAAGVGGADAVTVLPHDLLVTAEGPSELGRRMARNTQLLLAEESHLTRVLDPGGGSWYVEALTDAMAEQAWAWFQEIEGAGGMVAALESGMVHQRLDTTWAKRQSRVDRRKETIVGVNDFPNAADEVPLLDTPGSAPAGALPRHRYSERFEGLRQRTDAYGRAHGAPPAVLLVQLGTTSDFTARATYAKGFFETAGLRTVTVDVAPSADETETLVRSAVDENGAQLACLCSSDPLYAEHGPRLMGVMASLGLARTYLAGQPRKLIDALTEAGADEFIYVGCDVYEALARALVTIGVE